MLNFIGIKFAPDFTSRSDKAFAKAQSFIDSEVVSELEHYTPVAMERFRNRGKMSRSHKAESPGIIINTEPKARREYYTNKGFSGQGKFWLERMKADHKDEILRKTKEKFT